MGRTAVVTLVNATPYKWVRTEEEAEGITSWSLPDCVMPGQAVSRSIEWEVGQDADQGTARSTYIIEMTDSQPQFTVHADTAYTPDGGTSQMRLHVDLAAELASDVAWSTSPMGTQTVELPFLPFDAPIVFTLAGPGKTEAAAAAGLTPADLEGCSASSWMKRTSASIGELSVKELVYAGAHDAATYRMASPFTGPWASCQTLSLRELLDIGVRSLDLRVACYNDVWFLVHGIARTKTTLEDALTQVREFSEENPAEVVILDYHNLLARNDETEDEMVASLATLTKSVLGKELILPTRWYIAPLSRVWAEQSGRVIVLLGRTEWPLFGHRLWQKWAGDKVITPNQLEEYVKKVMVRSQIFWGIMAALPPSILNPWRIPRPNSGGCVDHWFHTGHAYMKYANVIYTDFVQKTHLVNNCIGQCLLRAQHKPDL